MLYIICQEDRADGAAIRAATKDAHFAYLEKHKDILVLGGAILAGDDDTTRVGSVFIVNATNLAAAQSFSENEPFRKAGLFKSVKVSRMRRGQWNPAAAPKSAEGN